MPETVEAVDYGRTNQGEAAEMWRRSRRGGSQLHGYRNNLERKRLVGLFSLFSITTQMAGAAPSLLPVRSVDRARRRGILEAFKTIRIDG
jgi:hypothetical protein